LSPDERYADHRCEEAAMKILRTPDERFENLPGWPYGPRYAEVEGIRIHYVDEGEGDETVLMLHGEPTWSYLYRKMIPVVAGAGMRVIAPDLPGFGRSDKPADMFDHSYYRHVRWITGFVEALGLDGITLVCQDWGGLIGLRVAAENERKFRRISASNTFLPTGKGKPAEAFLAWRDYSRKATKLPVGKIVAGGCAKKLDAETIAAYDAPFPDESYKAGARIFPSLVPLSPDDPAAADNQKAWEVLSAWEKPFQTAFTDGDPITKGGDAYFLKRVPGAKSALHGTLTGGHFVQEDAGEEWARMIVDFIRGK